MSDVVTKGDARTGGRAVSVVLGAVCVGFVFFRFVGAAQSETLAWSAAVDFLLLPLLLLGFLFSLRSFVLARRDVGLTYTLTDDVAGVVVTVTGRGDERRFATSDLVAIQQAFGARPPNQRWRFVFGTASATWPVRPGIRSEPSFAALGRT